MTFIDLEGDGPRSFAEVWSLIEETPSDATPTANIRRLTGRLQMRFPEPISWGFTPRGRLLGASFSYSGASTLSCCSPSGMPHTSRCTTKAMT